jgi:hypothetical protein
VIEYIAQRGREFPAGMNVSVAKESHKIKGRSAAIARAPSKQGKIIL